jgi:FMN phosphatase YigB (HAD superfamily)
VTPERDILTYERCMQELGTEPRSTIIVDDKTVSGVEIGERLGCTTYWIHRGKSAHEPIDPLTREHIKSISSIEDLLQYL